ncbi:MAG: type II toxin-antitoxin system Phd/YefM family antitoxin [Candidatus Bipolaricaulia bacterium]
MTVKVGATALRNQIGDLLARVIYLKERVIIERRDKPVAALISLEDLRVLERFEDERDAALLKAAKESSKSLVPFEELVNQYERLYGERLELSEESEGQGTI